MIEHKPFLLACEAVYRVLITFTESGYDIAYFIDKLFYITGIAACTLVNVITARQPKADDDAE